MVWSRIRETHCACHKMHVRKRSTVMDLVTLGRPFVTTLHQTFVPPLHQTNVLTEVVLKVKEMLYGLILSFNS